MRRIFLTVLLMAFGVAVASGQQAPVAPAATSANYDVALGYNYTRANAPPGGCDCFGLNGGFIAADFHFNDWVGITGKFTMGHANDIGPLGQDLTLSTFTVGPRFTYRMSRMSIFGDFLLGGAHGSGSYFPTATGSTTSASSFAYSTGGGIDIPITHRIGWRVIDAEYLHTSLPNGINDSQHQLELSTGIIFHFGHRAAYVAPPPASPVQPQVAFNCSQSAEQVTIGEPVEIIGNTLTMPGNQAVNYSWISNDATVTGSGNMVSVETDGLAPGLYHVYGHAALQSDSSVSGTCNVSFQVLQKPAQQVVTRTIVKRESPAYLKALADFNKNMKDAFFDLNKYNLRPDARAALAQDAQYLLAHPSLNITIAGFADERGTVEYNIMLGLQRALAAREYLVQQGVPMDRMNVLSYGKEKQFCSELTQACYQLNRRAHMELNPF